MEPQAVAAPPSRAPLFYLDTTHLPDELLVVLEERECAC